MANSVDLKHFGFEWKIKNALYVDRLDSDEFRYDGHRWKLSLHVTTYPGYGNTICYKNISLSKTSSGNLFNTYKVRCFIENTSEALVMPCEHDLDTTFSTQEVWCIAINTLVANKDQYLKDGTLTFVITFTANSSAKDGINDKAPDKSIQTSTTMDSVACLENLSHNLHHLMEDGSQSDITLQCDERPFPAHKIILSSRSAVFSAMFRSDMVENRSSFVEITDMDASTLSQFLQYIYSGKLSDLSEKTAPKLYAAADKYAVESLKVFSAKFMRENLTRENAIKFLVLADMHGDKCLKDDVLKFIANVELLEEKNAWFEFHNKHPKLASEVMHEVYTRKCHSKPSSVLTISMHV